MMSEAETEDAFRRLEALYQRLADYWEDAAVHTRPEAIPSDLLSAFYTTIADAYGEMFSQPRPPSCGR